MGEIKINLLEMYLAIKIFPYCTFLVIYTNLNLEFSMRIVTKYVFTRMDPSDSPEGFVP